MEKPSRRNLLKAAAVGGVTATGLSAIFGAPGAAAAGNDGRAAGHDHDHDDRRLSGARAHTVVAFGQWEVDPDDVRGPLDRMAPVIPPDRNVHKHLPFEAEVEKGGAVSFIISGLHQILIYEGLDFEDVKARFDKEGTVIPAPPGGPAFPPLVELPAGRVYRGVDPRTLFNPRPPAVPGDPIVLAPNFDRTESVNFFKRGRYLVVCGVLPHFNEGMFGYVRVRNS
jgi:hypothetical protein